VPCPFSLPHLGATVWPWTPLLSSTLLLLEVLVSCPDRVKKIVSISRTSTGHILI
jgi:hypothetical protein